MFHAANREPRTGSPGERTRVPRPMVHQRQTLVTPVATRVMIW